MASIRVLDSLVAPEELASRIDAEYALGSPSECRLVAANDNHTYLIRAAGDRYALRVHRHNKHWIDGESDYGFELDWLAYLAGRGVPVAPPVPRRDGGYLGSVEAPEGRRYTALFRFAPGRISLDDAQSEIFGRSVAEIHVASNDFTSSHHRVHFDLRRLIDKPLGQIREFIGDGRHADLSSLSDLAEELRSRVSGLRFSGDDYGIIGGDFHGGNHHFTDANEITHFDLDLCGHGWRAYDLAIFRWAHFDNDTLWNRVLAGYETVRPLSDIEQAAIPLFVPLRHLWWMGSHTTYATSPAWVTDENWDWKFEKLRIYAEKSRETG